MFRKINIGKQVEFIVTVVYYAVILSLLFVIACSFFKAIYAHHAQKIEREIISSGDIVVVAPAQAVPSRDTAQPSVYFSYDELDSIAETPTVQELTCIVTVVEDPAGAEPVQEVPEHAASDILFSVPLDAELQNHIFQVCEEHQIDPALVLAIIDRESNFDSAASGDGGASQGLMQVKREYHWERMAALGCNDLFDPKQNVTVGIDYLAELLNTYETVEMALMVYNGGATGANSYWFSNGIYSTEYSQSVLAMAEELNNQRALDTFVANFELQELRSVE